MPRTPQPLPVPDDLPISGDFLHDAKFSCIQGIAPNLPVPDDLPISGDFLHDAKFSCFQGIAPNLAPIWRSRRLRLPLSLPQSLHLCLTPRSISSRFPLRRKSGAHRLEIGPLLLTYLFSEGTYVSTYDVSPHYGPPSAISIDSRPPLLASGAHSIGFRMVVCVVYV